MKRGVPGPMLQGMPSYWPANAEGFLRRGSRPTCTSRKGNKGSGRLTDIGLRKTGGGPGTFGREIAAPAACDRLKTAVIVGGTVRRSTSDTSTHSWFVPTSTTSLLPGSILQGIGEPASGTSVPLSALTATVWGRGAAAT